MFVKPGGGWANGTQTAKLTASDGANSDNLGYSVSVSSDGSTVVAGAYLADPGGLDEGAAYVFEKGVAWADGSGNQTAKLTASDGAIIDKLGNSVSVSSDGGTVVAGASGADLGGTDKGAAYVFVKPGGGWTNGTQTAKLTASDGANNDFLGNSVSVSSDGSTIVAGAYQADPGGSNRGAAYVFVKPGGGWANGTETAKLTASDGADSDNLGYSVSVSSDGSTVVAGAYKAAAGGTQRGAVYTWTAPTPTPTPTSTPTPTPPPDPGTYYTVTITKTGTGSGNVTGAPVPITWSDNTGVVSRPEYSVETLTAAASAGSVFAGWSGDCSGTLVGCTMSMTKNYNVTATFNLPSKTLTVSRLGTGNGNVTVSPGVLTWVGNSTTAEYQDSTVVTLTATAPDDSTFTGWGGDCNGTETTCTVKMTTNLSITATFTLKPRTLTVTKTGTGGGTVTVSPGNLPWSGGATTSEVEYPDGTEVTLTAGAFNGSVFGGWSGDCQGTNATCKVTMSKDVNVSADFGLTRKLTINITGKGMVTASKGIIHWNFNTGVAYYADGTEETLTAKVTPDSGSTFKEWTGCDATDGARCIVKMTDSKTVTANFSQGVKNDFDADGKSDVFLQDSSTGDTAIWLINGMSVSSKGYPAKGVSGVWRFLAKGDFDGDGKTDALWQHTNGDVVAWLMNATKIAKQAYVTRKLPAEWLFKGIGDFNGDDKADILWQHTNGDVSIWLMNGAGISTKDYVEKGVPPGWQIKGVGDFDGDGKNDILWQHTNGDVAVWFMAGLSVKSKSDIKKAVSSNWQIKGVGDFNGDGKTDIIWQDSSTGDVVVWLIDGATVTSKGVVSAALPGNWKLKDTGDYDGDGKDDILWQDSSTGDVAVWFMDGTSIAGKRAIEKALPGNWMIK
ncbi:InlB B-repeat-containing protein [Candidatus Magnetobacterium casense]|uniref:InlB B-repeat-containing protein n=1 Tax=Candidatus Magnetobacterium casense TaxID=1455061 RepID=UPI0006967FB1|nr:FG-GAP-like repeat-containing protein [Candidatus Magnetobacterium casensis]